MSGVVEQLARKDRSDLSVAGLVIKDWTELEDDKGMEIVKYHRASSIARFRHPLTRMMNQLKESIEGTTFETRRRDSLIRSPPEDGWDRDQPLVSACDDKPMLMEPRPDADEWRDRLEIRDARAASISLHTGERYLAGNVLYRTRGRILGDRPTVVPIRLILVPLNTYLVFSVGSLLSVELRARHPQPVSAILRSLARRRTKTEKRDHGLGCQRNAGRYIPFASPTEDSSRVKLPGRLRRKARRGIRGKSREESGRGRNG
ncbi:hypothetical protein C8R46DRAFT_1187270 [Mycena filopes]|nr:hypothetical protein C8R46DRAFT_1187270 [Mycena filopes]